jgi:hypothetical protein
MFLAGMTVGYVLLGFALLAGPLGIYGQRSSPTGVNIVTGS